MGHHTRDHSGQGVDEALVARVGDCGVDRREVVAETAGRNRVAREEARDIGAVPGDERIDLRRTVPQQRASRTLRRQEADGVSGRAKPVHGPAQQQDVAQRPRADEERLQIT